MIASSLAAYKRATDRLVAHPPSTKYVSGCSISTSRRHRHNPGVRKPNKRKHLRSLKSAKPADDSSYGAWRWRKKGTWIRLSLDSVETYTPALLNRHVAGRAEDPLAASSKGLRQMNHRSLAVLATLLLVVCGGCSGYGSLLGSRGSIQQQRYSATVHDPYADNEAGPEVVGGRPPGFAKPLAEPVRSRPFWERWWGS